MSGIGEFLKKMRAAHKMGRRIPYGGDPGKGLEYNKFLAHHGVSRKVYSVDIARTPQIVPDSLEFVDVHGEGWKANRMRPMIDYISHKAKGR